jgi:hypothetical protein
MEAGKPVHVASPSGAAFEKCFPPSI